MDNSRCPLERPPCSGTLDSGWEPQLEPIKIAGMTIIELRITPPFERATELGVLARLTIPHGWNFALPTIAARRRHAMDWMEQDPAAEWESVKESTVDPGRAQSLLAKAAGGGSGVFLECTSGEFRRQGSRDRLPWVSERRLCSDRLTPPTAPRS